MNSSCEFAYCRFCAEIKPFDDLLDLEENPQDIKDCIERVNLLKIDFVNILSCKLPKVICEPCYNDLYDASLFISKVKEAQIIINDLIDTKSEIGSHEHKFDIGEAQSGTGNIGEPDIEKNYIEIDETKIKTEKDPLHIDDNVIEDLTTLVDSSEAREDTVKEEVPTCSGIIKNYNNLAETPQYIDRNINDSNDLVEKRQLQNITDVGVSNNSCPRLKVRLECILKDNNIQNSLGSNDNDFEQNWSSPKSVDGLEENIAKSVNYFNDISYSVNASDTLKGLLTLSDESTLHSPNSFQCVTHSDIENISGNFLSKERQVKNNNEDYLKGTLSKAIQNYDQNVFADLNEDEIEKNADNVVQDNQFDLPDNISWSEYVWLCQHCDTDYRSMRVVREHSKLVHNKCCAFKCIDCPDLFISFISFVEHVRQHRKSLRLYCPFCNEKFSTPEECANHSYNHWVTSKACDRCGELLTNTEELMKHNKQHREAFYLTKYAKTTAPCVPKDESFTWDNYEMACQMCHLTTPDIETLRRHADEVHQKCFANKCVDCLKVLRDFKTFVNHVLQHRPWLKIPCLHCPETFGEEKALTAHLKSHETESQKACNACSQMFEGKLLQEHVQKYNVPGHRFVTCGICFKNFATTTNLKIHTSRQHKLSLCHVCGSNFSSTEDLKKHLSGVHNSDKVKCQYCNFAFKRKYLRKHVKLHLNLPNQFICEDCGKSFKSKNHIRNHITNVHVYNILQCKSCKKQFKTRQALKSHLLQHTGYKPYRCRKCPLTFTHWGNCNIHMKRRHGVTLAKTKLTTMGRFQVTETGQVLQPELKDNVKKWLSDIAQGSLRKRK